MGLIPNRPPERIRHERINKPSNLKGTPMPKTPEARPTIKKPRHVAIATNHLVIQREKAISVRDKAASEVQELDAALIALGWME